MQRAAQQEREVVIERIVRKLCELVERGERVDKRRLHELKLEAAKGAKYFPSDWEVLRALPEHVREKLRRALMSKPVRTLSGIAVIAVMTKPLPCPGQCIYCPGGIGSPFGDTPKSYTSESPAARRAAELNYDPYLQVRRRIEQLEAMGHVPQKISLIVMGGTFLAAPREYKEEFMRGVYEGILGERHPDKSLEELQLMLERSRYRLVELTFETRPDWCFEKHVDEMLKYGATRVEIGVQTLDEDVLRLVRRGHGVEEIRKAFQVARDAGLKICAHIMPQLPGSTPEKDLEVFRRLFDDPDFRPDMLKIYPTVVVKGTILYEMWKRGEYEPYPPDVLIDLIAKMKRETPPWVRIQRVQRDIPMHQIEAGVPCGNLREVVRRYMEKLGWRCRCIRCREVGHAMRRGVKPEPEVVRLVVRKYEASGGLEYFISFEDVKNDVLIGFVRLRKPSERAHRPEVDQNTTIIRELHVYGPLVPLGQRSAEGWQHRGYGRRLIAEAERIAVEELDARKMLIISGIGVREYYYRLGYRREGPYVSKRLR